MQNIYLSFLKVFNNEKYSIKNNLALLITISKRELFRYYKSIAKIKDLFTDFDVENFSFDSNPTSDLIVEKDQYDRVFELIKKEELLTQKILVLYYLNDLKIGSIAKIFGVSDSFVKNRLYRAVFKIKEGVDV